MNTSATVLYVQEGETTKKQRRSGKGTLLTSRLQSRRAAKLKSARRIHIHLPPRARLACAARERRGGQTTLLLSKPAGAWTAHGRTDYAIAKQTSRRLDVAREQLIHTTVVVLHYLVFEGRVGD